MKHLHLCLILLMAMIGTEVSAQKHETTSFYGLSVGRTQTLDTYLSPEHYHGTELRLLSERNMNRDGRMWSRRFQNETFYSNASTDAGSGNELSLHYAMRYSWLRLIYAHADRWKVQVGPGAEAYAGGCYSTRNGNNPAQFYCNAAATLALTADYRRKILHRQVDFQYRACLPVVGIMFSPNYGQSYFEIFSRGNYDHNIVPTTPVSRPSLQQQLHADIHFKHHTWRIGYLGDYQQASVNNLKQHRYTHALLLGMVF